MVAGCSSYQPTKNVWKGTKDVWYTYVSPPASVDYGEKGDLSPRALALTNCMMGLDVELGRFERTMINADKPPTRQWMDSLLPPIPGWTALPASNMTGPCWGRSLPIL